MSKKTTDDNEYTLKEIRQSRPGSYHLSRLLPTEISIFPEDSQIRPQYTGSSLSTTLPPVVMESDMRGLGRPQNRESVDTVGHHVARTPSFIPNITASDAPHLRTSNSRLELPPIAIKGLASNRFHPQLHHNPSEKTMAPFDRMVSSRIVMKDQWRPPRISMDRVHPPTIPGRIKPKSVY